MLRLLLAAIAVALPALAAADDARRATDFDFVSIDGSALPLTKFEGQVVLVVNTASFCGFTRQYEDLQALWERYRDQGLVVLGVPSNDFGAQEPGAREEIKEFCEVNFGINFPMTDKAVVRGADADPFYLWAAETLGEEARPRWNFHKYLVGRDGALAGWFPTRTEPDAPELIEAIEAQLAAPEG